MAAQSRPAILITRPAEGGARFARALRRRLGPGLRIISAPLMAPRWRDADLPSGAAALIFTSEAGVAGLARLTGDRTLPAFCVGAHTAAVARRAGFSAYVAGRDAAELLGTLRATERGPFLVVRGQDAAADIAAAFREAGREASEAIVYAQEPRPLPPRALRLLAGAGAVVLPVFSARSGALLAEAARGAHARLMIAAISPAAARPLDLLRPARTLCAETPTAAGVLDAVAMLVGAGDKTP